MNFNDEFMKRKEKLIQEMISFNDVNRTKFLDKIREELASEKYRQIESWQWSLTNHPEDLKNFDASQLISIKAKLDTILETGQEGPELKRYDPM